MTKKSYLYACMTGLTFFVLYFLYVNAWPFIIANRSDISAFYQPNFGSLKIHVIGGTMMLGLGLHQLISGWLGVNKKHHKMVGYIYLTALLLGLSGYWGLIGSTQPMSFKFSLTALAIIWLITASMAYWAIRVRNVIQHREWMMRNYATTTAFIILRIFIDNPDFRSLFPAPEDFLAGGMFIAIVGPLLLTEILLQSPKIIKR